MALTLPASFGLDEPDWDALPDLIPSTTVAAILGVHRRTLIKYAQTGKIPRAVERGANWANYAKADVRAFWEFRLRRMAQGFVAWPVKHNPIPPDLAETQLAPIPGSRREAALREEAALIRAQSGTDPATSGHNAAISGHDPATPDLITLPLDQAQMLGQAVAAGITQATAPLLVQIAELTGQVAALTAELQQRQQPPNSPVRVRKGSPAPRRR